MRVFLLATAVAAGISAEAFACGGGGGGGGGQSQSEPQIPPACVAALAREPAVKAGLEKLQAEIDFITREAQSVAHTIASAAKGEQLDSSGKAAQNYRQAMESLDRQRELAGRKSASAKAYASELGIVCAGVAEAEPVAAAYGQVGAGEKRVALAKLGNAAESAGLGNGSEARASKLCTLGARGCANLAAPAVAIGGKSENGASTVTGNTEPDYVVHYRRPDIQAPADAPGNAPGALSAAGAFVPARAQAPQQDSQNQSGAPATESRPAAEGGGRSLASVGLPETSRGFLDPVPGSSGWKLGSLRPSAPPHAAARPAEGDTSDHVARGMRESELQELSDMLGQVDRERAAEAMAGSREAHEELSLFQRISKQVRRPERLF